MANDFTAYRLSEVRRSIQILKETLERRVYLDDTISQKFEGIELEVSMLEKHLKEK